MSTNDGAGYLKVYLTPLSQRMGAVTLSNRSRVNLAGKFESRRGRHGLPYAHRFAAKLP